MKRWLKILTEVVIIYLCVATILYFGVFQRAEPCKALGRCDQDLATWKEEVAICAKIPLDEPFYLPCHETLPPEQWSLGRRVAVFFTWPLMGLAQLPDLIPFGR